MSGQNVPYHIRQNKAIDRNLFVELLSKLNVYKSISGYTYISFGGSFLEDFKLIHALTGISKMISLEEDSNVLKRQEFNLPISCIELRQQRSGEFLSSHTFEGENIVWFDYASPKDLEEQIGETQYLVTQLHEGDIIKITLNANANSLADAKSLEIEKAKRSLKNCNEALDDLKKRATDESDPPPANVESQSATSTVIDNADSKLSEDNVPAEKVAKAAVIITPSSVELYNFRLTKFKQRAGKYFLSDTDVSDMNKKESYPNLLCKTLKIAIQQAMESKPHAYFQPLTAFSYSDSEHTMLTYTGVMLSNNDEEIDGFFKLTRLRDWNLFQPDGDRSIEIRIPNVSLKERLKIDSLLPKMDETEIQSELGFFIYGYDERSSIEGLKQYIKYYKQYPQFLRVAV